MKACKKFQGSRAVYTKKVKRFKRIICADNCVNIIDELEELTYAVDKDGEIIEDEFQYRKLRCPIHHIDTRLKSAKSILGKLQKKDLDLTLGAACNNIYDIAGIRVVCSYMKDVYLIRDRIVAQDDIYIMEIKDYIKEPKKNGYRSLHMTVRVPVYFMNKKQMVPVELQIRTLAMDLWASLEHDIKYKSLYQAGDTDFSDELKECSRLIYEAEKKMEVMNAMLEA